MPKIDRTDIRKGQLITGAVYPVGDERRSQIKKGAVMSALGGEVKRAPLPKDLEHFEAAADQMALFERQHAASIAEIARRLEAVREGLQRVKRK